jgi:hypothetical protein
MIRHNIRTFILETFSMIDIGSILEGWEEVSILAGAIDRVFVADACEWSTSSRIKGELSQK